MKPIFLVGYMCCGKSTLGRALERRAGVEYVDLDELIEAEQGMSINDIFALKGEDEFRRLEAGALARMAERNDLVVGCGGGTPCHGDNMALMNSRGLTVLLEACRERLLQRLLEGRAKRPRIALLSDAEVEAAMGRDLESRRVHYEKAASRFDSSCLETEEEVAATVERFIKKYNLPLRR